MRKLTECIPRTDWLVVFVGVVLAVVGLALTLTWVGAIIGGPLFLGSLELVFNNKTLLGTPCSA